MKKLMAGNWKMNGTAAAARELASAVVAGADDALRAGCDFVLCPPFVHLAAVKPLLPASIGLGGQDCAAVADGAYTGDISAAMLKDIGCNYVILGHSERREYHNEIDAGVAAKAVLAHRQGLVTIICVGESAAERAAGRETDVVERQLAGSIPPGATAENTVIAYEPVWAIGTGKVATVEDVRAMHSFIRGYLKRTLADSGNMRILYGGSVKPDNAAALCAVDNVDGALIGGASLKADQFLAIARAAVTKG